VVSPLGPRPDVVTITWPRTAPSITRRRLPAATGSRPTSSASFRSRPYTRFRTRRQQRETHCTEPLSPPSTAVGAPIARGAPPGQTRADPGRLDRRGLLCPRDPSGLGGSGLHCDLPRSHHRPGRGAPVGAQTGVLAHRRQVTPSGPHRERFILRGGPGPAPHGPPLGTGPAAHELTFATIATISTLCVRLVNFFFISTIRQLSPLRCRQPPVISPQRFTRVVIPPAPASDFTSAEVPL
jgi:hypothetical protein